LTRILLELAIPYRPFRTLDEAVEEARLVSGRLPIA
jgi:hypothetical protein